MRALTPWVKEKLDARECVDCPECRRPSPAVGVAETDEGWGDIVFECSMCGRFEGEAWPDEEAAG